MAVPGSLPGYTRKMGHTVLLQPLGLRMSLPFPLECPVCSTCPGPLLQEAFLVLQTMLAERPSL